MRVSVLAGLVVLAGVGRAAAAPTPLPRAAPEAEGVSSAGLLEFIEAADQKLDSLHGVVVVRHGKVVAEGWWRPYDARSPHEMYSLSKSFTSTAVGLAVADGKLSVDDEVLKFFPDDAPADPPANLKAMRVRDLLTMSAGHQDETSSAADKITPRSFLAHPVPHKPGTHFKYNTPATFMLSAIVQKVTGQSVLEYLRPRLFDPLGIESPTWTTNTQGISLGGYGLSVRTEDIARFGLLYLQKGRWQGRQLVPAAWVDAATSRQMSNGSNPASDWDQGYGFQFWRARHGAYRGDGAFGQFCLVLPAQDAVVAITAGLRDMQAVLNLIWDKLLPAMQPRPLRPDAEARRKLAARLAALSLRGVDGAASSPIAARVAGVKFAFADNAQKLQSLAIEPGALVMQVDGRPQRIEVGQSEWRRGRLQVPAMGGERAVAATGAWTSDDTYVVKLCLYETPFVWTVTLRFGDGQVTFERQSNVGFGATKDPPLVGRAH